MKEIVSRPFVTRTTSLFFRKCGLCPSDLGRTVGLGFEEKFASLEEVQAKFGEGAKAGV